MRDYISLLLNPDEKCDVILHSFYLHPIGREQKAFFSPEQLEQSGRRLFAILLSTPMEHILDVIEQYKDEIVDITTGSVPQFSKLEDADLVPSIVLSNPNCKYKLIGYFFNKDAADFSNQKYGENHYKLAAQLGLCENIDKKKEENTTAVSFLGYIYKDLPLSERNILRAKLCLQVPFIQHILVEARHGRIDAMRELLNMFTQSTAIRRRSSLQQMIHAIEKTLTVERNLTDNIEWGYKKK